MKRQISSMNMSPHLSGFACGTWHNRNMRCCREFIGPIPSLALNKDCKSIIYVNPLVSSFICYILWFFEKNASESEIIAQFWYNYSVMD